MTRIDSGDGPVTATDQTESIKGSSAAPLEGVRVLELSDRLGAYCGKLLADLGADVIKVELPEGDVLRRTAPFRDGASEPEGSLNFAYYHHNKRGITLDWRRSASLTLLTELASLSEAVIVSPGPRSPVAGYCPDEPGHLSWSGQNTIRCFVTPFGLTGPFRSWRATPFTSYAMSSLMHSVGPVAGPPVAQPGQQLYDECGVHAALTIQALLEHPEARSQYIDVSVHEVGWFKKLSLERYSLRGRLLTRATNFGPPPGGTWRCVDGYVNIAAHAHRHWDIFLEVLDRPKILMDPLYQDRAMRIQVFDLLTGFIADLLSTRSAKEFVEKGQALGLPCELRYTPSEFLEDIQPRARHFFVESSRPDSGVFPIPGRPYRSDPDLIGYRMSAPTLGQHNEAVYVGELGHARKDLESWRSDGLI